MADRSDALNPETVDKDYESLKKIASELIRENGELKNKLHEGQRELHLLYTVIRKVSYSMEWNEIQEMILDIILEFLPVARFSLIALYPESGNRMIVRMKSHKNESPTMHNVFLKSDIDETTSWDEIVATDEWNEFAFKIHYLRELQSSFIPLSVKDKEIGFMMVAKDKQAKYTEGEWHFLSSIAHHFAVTLENSRLYHLAISDALTGLFNRRYFFNRLERETEKALHRNSPLSLLMIDIDHFKRVNDTHGHSTGDVILKQIASRIGGVAPGSAINCRYGGEEFTTILPDTEKDPATAIAESIRKRVAEEPFEVSVSSESLPLDITVSIGVATCPIDAQEIGDIINKADQSMYLAKAEGRNRVV